MHPTAHHPPDARGVQDAPDAPDAAYPPSATSLPRGRRATRARRARQVPRLAATVLALAATTAVLATAASAGPAGGATEPPLASAFAAMNPVTPLTASTFTNPPQNDMPWVRWNWAPATTSIAELQAELQEMHDNNIAGVEIGQGGVPTKEQLTAIFTTANQLGITVSLKAANGLPGATYSSSDDYARRTLNSFRQTVSAGGSVSGPVPGPTSGNPGTIVAVLAYRCTTTPCATAGTVELDRSSVVDLTGQLTGTNGAGYNGGTQTGSLSWTAPAQPAGAQWVVLTFRAVPFGSEPETLSLAGTKQVTDAYDAYLAGGLGDLMKANKGDFFVDSHASDPWGAPEELWASDMRNEFQARAGYDIVPNLAALVDPTMAGAGLGGPPPPTAVFYSFSDGSGSRVRSDFNRVRSTMYTQYRLVPFQSWSHTYDSTLRVQQEDGPVTSIGDQLETSAVLDRSEYESLTGSDQADIYRPMASANHMTGNTWYSTECCADLNESYVATYQDAIIRMNHEFAGGVNRIVYHIRPQRYTPTTTWPGMGFSASKVTFSNGWNANTPYYSDSAAMNAYFARNHLVLTQGVAKTDVAVYQRNYSSPSAFSTTDPNNRHWQDLGLQRSGYTWDYLDEPLLDLPNAVVTNKRLAEAGPAYKAFVFDQFLYPTSNTARGSLSVEAAEKILGYAKAGLPVIFVGEPTGTGSLNQDDGKLASIVSQILAQKSVSQVASEADVPARLAALGITPAAQPAGPTSLLSVRRSDASTSTDYYWLYNQGVESWQGGNGTFGLNPSNLYEEPSACRRTVAGLNPCMATGAAVDTTVTLEGKGAPYQLDLFSGGITPIAQYTRTGQTVTVHVQLARDESTVIALSNDPKRFDIKRPDNSVTSTTADSVAQVGSSIVARAAQAGSYVTTLETGGTVTSAIGAVPAPIDLTSHAWHLDAEDWQPTNPYGIQGAAGSETTKVPVSLDLSALQAWPDIPALQNSAGIGTYRTSFSLPAGWDGSYGATLSLGQVTDTFRVTVNGHAVAVDQVSGTIDIGPYLTAGDNTLEVRVATSLNNRLYALDQAVRNRGVIQAYGLIGPVVVTPYRQAVVWSR